MRSLILGLLVAASGQASVGAPAPDVTAAANQFACDLYQRLAPSERDVFFSPVSVVSALTMAYAGADGATADQMARVLHIKQPGPAWFTAMGALQRQVLEPVMGHDGPAFVIDLANRLWVQSGFALQDTFAMICSRDLGAAVAQVDFDQAAPQARLDINHWVSEHTSGKIPELLAPGTITGDTRLVLTNAIYFRGQWLYPFDGSQTSDLPFFLNDGGTANVPMMHQEETFGYADDDRMQVLQLPYTGGHQVCEIFLPRDVQGLGALETALDATKLASWHDLLQPRRVDVLLPRFEITMACNLDDVLAQLGMPDAFSAHADFSRITGDASLSISDVVHEATITVDEAGTEAAAATAAGMALTSMPMPQEPVGFKADHPFLFVIRDVRTGAVLFMGRVNDPRG